MLTTSDLFGLGLIRDLFELLEHITRLLEGASTTTNSVRLRSDVTAGAHVPLIQLHLKSRDVTFTNRFRCMFEKVIQTFTEQCNENLTCTGSTKKAKCGCTRERDSYKVLL